MLRNKTWDYSSFVTLEPGAKGNCRAQCRNVTVSAHTLNVRHSKEEHLKITSQLQYTWIFISDSQNCNEQQWY